MAIESKVFTDRIQQQQQQQQQQQNKFQ